MATQTTDGVCPMCDREKEGTQLVDRRENGGELARIHMHAHDMCVEKLE